MIVVYNPNTKTIHLLLESKPGDKEHIDRCWFFVRSFLVAVGTGKL